MRILIGLLSLLYVFSCHAGESIRSAKSNDKNSPVDGEPEHRFVTKHIWDAKVDIGSVLELGASKYGTRRTIPILGGTFTGPHINGTVIPGGADWQVTRADGDTELHARYLLKTNDGVLIQVINRALIHSPVTDEKNVAPYIRSVLELEAPSDSKYAYLNHAIFLGTLEIPQLKPGENPYVIIGVHQLL
ncbi:MAG: DUF3237 domain-containing protein [Gammaproteobacteria bacterium]|nr:MAG: DUF3237 domain-containing protein [Gammaproteobacteria bacterium]